MEKVKSGWFIVIHILATCFSYGAARIVIAWAFSTDFKLLGNAFRNICFALGIFVVLPILGIIVIRYHNNFLRRAGWLYLGLWLLAVVRIVGLFMNTD